MKPILDARPDISGLADPYGRTILHTACKFGASISIIQSLLYNSISAVHKESPFIHGSFKVSRPIDYLYYFYARKPKETTHQFLHVLKVAHSVRCLDQIELNLFWKKIALLFMAMHYGTDGVREAIDREYNDPVLIFKVYCSMLRYGFCSIELEVFVTKMINKMIDEANVFMYHQCRKRLLINILIEANLDWIDGIRQIADVAPLSLCTRDPKTKMYPFMIAASVTPADCDDRIGLNRIYMLLCKDPEAVRIGLPV